MIAGCGWRTALVVDDGSVTSSDLGGRDGGPPPIDFGPPPDFGPPRDFGPPPIDFGPPPPPDLGHCDLDSECDDGLVCNGHETCVAGSCQPGMPFPCGDPFICTNDICTEATLCEHIPDSSRCPDGEICSPTIGCTSMMCPAGGCDDGIFCDGAELCGPDGLCHSGPAPCGPPGGPCGPVCDELSHSCTMATVDADGDGHFALGCGGDDCNDMNPSVHPGAPEICNDGIDDDCNGLTDCMDPSCFASPSCGCIPRPEICDNGIDDDCNGLIDCADTVCLMMTACTRCIDHDIGSTMGRNIELPPTTNIGSPNRFNPVDCGMGGSSGNEVTYGWTAPSTGDYVIDTIGSTYDTVLYVLQGCGLPNIPGACNDDSAGGLQSTIDVHLVAGQHVVIVIDAWSPGQVGTYSLSITAASMILDGGPPPVDAGPPPVDSGPPPIDGGMCGPHENSIALCTNHRDDNCNGQIDCADPECSPFGPMGECCNGIDDNHDGLIDEFTCRCFSDADCVGVGSLSQSCWLTTFSVCAPRCNFYGGTAWCRMYLGAASTCNAMTGECEGAVLGGGGTDGG